MPSPQVTDGIAVNSNRDREALSRVSNTRSLQIFSFRVSEVCLCMEGRSSLRNMKSSFVLPKHEPFNITVIQVYAPTSNAEEAEVEWFYEDLQNLLELTPKKDVLFIIGDWNAKVASQETPGVTGKFGLGIWNEAGQRLIEFCQDDALVIANILFQQHKRRLYTWTSPDG